MKTQNLFLFMFTLIFGLVFWGCEQCNECDPEPDVDVYDYEIELGVTPLGEIFGYGTGQIPLSGLVDPSSYLIYVDSVKEAEIIDKLDAEVMDEHFWYISDPSMQGEYEIIPIEQLDLNTPISVGVQMLAEGYCKERKKGYCLSFGRGAPSTRYSWKLPEDVCKFYHKEGESVKLSHVKAWNNVPVYKGWGCVGSSTSNQNKGVWVCEPSDCP